MPLSSWVDKKDVLLEIQPTVLQDNSRVGVQRCNCLLAVDASKLHRETYEPGLNLFLFNFQLILETFPWNNR